LHIAHANTKQPSEHPVWQLLYAAGGTMNRRWWLLSGIALAVAALAAVLAVFSSSRSPSVAPLSLLIEHSPR